MAVKRPRIAFVGNLAGGALMMERPVARLGVFTVMMLSPTERKTIPATLQGHPLWAEPKLRIVEYGFECPASGFAGKAIRRLRYEWSALKALVVLFRADIIQSFTGSLFEFWAWRLAFSFFKLRPYIACATGSDLREVAANDRGPAGIKMRRFFARAQRVLLLNVDMLKASERLGMRHARFFPFAVDTSAFSPGAVVRTVGRSDEMLVFMPSHLDWGVVDNSSSRSSTKGNDRLIRAFARFLNEGGRAHLLLLDRGPDRNEARSLIENLGISQNVTIKPQMTKAELVAHMNMADVIADQFDIGAFGTTALEAMACGKVVLMHIDMAQADRCYTERPPLLSASSEESILAALRHASDRTTREELGERARAWVVRFHDENVVAQKLLEIYKEVVRP